MELDFRACQNPSQQSCRRKTISSGGHEPLPSHRHRQRSATKRPKSRSSAPVHGMGKSSGRHRHGYGQGPRLPFVNGDDTSLQATTCTVPVP
ncbi:hypothetical protein BJX63DRAFT_354887 [Aspergillus granulosus]|uniref:Uncharacterized protein n=1 Tax=Aspergillus granulosus TaxID=176169 RepID=A0ABR4H1Y2_9EURO